MKTGSLGSEGVRSAVRRELRSRVIVFVFDESHLSADGYKRARTAVESFLKDVTASADVIGVVSSGTMLNNKIDSDKAALLKAMSGMKGPNLSRFNEMRTWPRILDETESNAIARSDRETLNRAVLRACSEQPADCQSLGGDEPVRQQVEAKARQIASEAQRDAERSLATIQTLANGLGRLPGTKNVVVFSDGFFTGELNARLKDVVTLAARNNVRFSTMDTRGLNRDPRSQNFMSASPMQAAGDLTPLTTDNNSDVLSSLAIDTGSEMFMNRNDLRPAVDIVARQAGTYYVLGYAPTRVMDGNYHNITVHVTRPGLTVRARKGYIATSSGDPALASTAVERSVGNTAGSSGGTTSGSSAQPTATSSPTLPAADVAPAAPATTARFRPNAGGNVSSLTRVMPDSGGPSDVKTLADTGWDAYALGDVIVAREKLGAAVATGKAAPWVSYALGFATYATGQYDAAATAWESVRARVPEFMPVYFDLADAFISLGRSGDALNVLRDAARRWPVEPEPQNALGTLLVRRGSYDDAIDVLTHITTAKPVDSLGFFNLGRAYQLRYLRLQQNVASARLPAPSAIGEEDRQRALTAYRHYLTLGGPFENEAKNAIATLDWK